MIAQLHIPLEGDDGYTLTLDDEGRWVSTDWPDVAEAMNDAHMHENNESWKAHDAAKRLGGEILYLKVVLPSPEELMTLKGVKLTD